MQLEENIFRRHIAFILIFFLFLFPSCSKTETKSERLHLAVENRDEKGKNRPISVSILIDNVQLIQKQTVGTDKPLSIIQPLTEGKHNIKVNEEVTKAAFNVNVVMDKEKWLRVTFYRQGEGMGYFEGKLQERPFGYEAEKMDDNKTQGKGMKVEGKDRDRKAFEDEVDKKLDDMVKENEKTKKEKSTRYIKNKKKNDVRK